MDILKAAGDGVPAATVASRDAAAAAANDVRGVLTGLAPLDDFIEEEEDDAGWADYDLTQNSGSNDQFVLDAESFGVDERRRGSDVSRAASEQSRAFGSQFENNLHVQGMHRDAAT